MLDEPDSSKPQRAAPKPYERPTLAKGPVLAAETAQTSVSGGVSTDGSSTACWVARAAFGESDVRWMIFRAWLLEDAPAWFRRLYIRYGETVGTWLAGREGARRVVRKLMTPAINRKLRG